MNILTKNYQIPIFRRTQPINIIYIFYFNKKLQKIIEYLQSVKFTLNPFTSQYFSQTYFLLGSYKYRYEYRFLRLYLHFIRL